MPPKYPWPAKAQQTETLHIYRHLLREISYLPPAFSPSISSHVRQRFRSNRTPDQHSKNRIARAKRTLRTIKLANHGDGPRMLKLMQIGFGRTGPRRWELLRKLREPEGPEDSDALEALTGTTQAAELSAKQKEKKRRSEQPWPGQKIDSDSEKAVKAARNADTKAKAASDPENQARNRQWLEKWDRPTLNAFMKSQKEQQAKVDAPSERGELKQINETKAVPTETTWGKWPSKVLVRAKVAEYWMKQASRIMPPLGKGEWELLGQLSAGAQEKGEWKLPKKRTPAKPSHEGQQSGLEKWDWESHATQKTRGFEPSNQVKHFKRLGGETTPFTGQTTRDSLSERWFRRHYRQIYVKTAHTEKNPNTLKDEYVWGARAPYNAKPLPHQMRLFETPEKEKP